VKRKEVLKAIGPEQEWFSIVCGINIHSESSN
jgi:hypothetical protein